ncbi:MAG: hypothetical protein IJ787_04320 [Bacilli bacterium]|nr:hypothetical protein [Bacilli bacterium]
MKKNKKNSLFLFATLGIVAALTGGTALVLQAISANGTVQYEDDTKLLIGVPKSCEGDPVKLTITARSVNGVETIDLQSTDLKPMKGQDASAVFYDYGSSPAIETKGQSIGYWLADSNNSITVRTTAKSAIASAEVDIPSAGIWFVNVAETDGAKPDVQHAKWYSQKIGFGGDRK